MDVQKLIWTIFLMTQNTCCHSKGGFTPKLAEAYTNHLKDETSWQQGRCCLWGGVQHGRYSLMIWFRVGKQCRGWLGNCERTQVLAFCGLASLSKQIREIAFTELHSHGWRKTVVMRIIGYHWRWLVACTQDKGLEVIFISSDRCLVWDNMALLEVHKGNS